ncbi:hypothetical protein FJZ31_08175 [Candidatus Poribacteria bacterium]|nr:hypothetical protein [Candidatus Poribacteria bacterium]
MEAVKKIDPIPETFDSIEEAAEFWDSHDTVDYEEYLKEVKDLNFNIKTITREVKLEPDIALKISRFAKAKGISFSSLVNLWMKEKLEEIEWEANLSHTF